MSHIALHSSALYRSGTSIAKRGGRRHRLKPQPLDYRSRTIMSRVVPPHKPDEGAEAEVGRGFHLQWPA